jgi:membrane protease YdiL (CAAX protease family)
MTARLGREPVAVAAIVLVPFVAAAAALGLATPPGADQLAAADPLVRTLRAWLGAWSVPAIAIGACAAAIGLGLARPRRAELRRGLALALGGALAGAALLAALAAAGGGRLPSFVPPEESARPGLLLGLEAGVVEEALFRLLALPLLARSLGARLGARKATITAVVATGVLFALSHEIGPGAAAFRLDLFLTRSVVPGIAMSALAAGVGPSFIVAAHCAAHVAMPFVVR